MTDDDYEDITGSTKAENILFLTDPLLIFESDVPTTAAIYEEEQTSKSCLPELYLPVPLYLQDHACLQVLHHSSEIRGLRSTKCSSETLQNLLCFMYKKSHVVFFVFHFMQLYIFTI